MDILYQGGIGIVLLGVSAFIFSNVLSLHDHQAGWVFAMHVVGALVLTIYLATQHSVKIIKRKEK